MRIIGAGMAGLLAGRHFPHSKIFERQSSLPNNHSALLRFRTDAVSKATGIPFKKVLARKAVASPDGELRSQATLRDSNMYSLKVTGKISDRSIIDLAPGERWIAPGDFIERLADGLDIEYNCSAEADQFDGDGPVISTMPMPALMKMLRPGHDQMDFQYLPIWVVNCVLPDIDLYQTIYIPDENDLPYRVTITGDKLTMEFSRQIEHTQLYKPAEFVDYTLFDGKQIPVDCQFNIKKQAFGKIVPIDNQSRQSFIMWATDMYNIYSLGRFAVWRPILLDDLVSDLQSIRSFMNTRNRYDRRKQGIKVSSQELGATWVDQMSSTME